MADSSVSITEGSGKNIDTRTNASGDHRQVVVLGNESATDSVASVQATDPTSAALGLVVREPNSTAIVSGLRDVRVQSLVDGTVSIENITRVRNVVDGTLSTVTRVSNVVDGTLSVVTFVPTVQRVQNVVDGTLTTVTGVDRVRNLVDGTISTVDTVTRVNRVMNLIDGTLSTVGAVTGITNSINVHILSTNGTMAVFSRASGTVAVTAADGTFAVRFSPSTPNVAILSNAQPIGNSGVVGATTQRVVHAVDVAQSMNIVAIGTTNTLGVYLSATAGTINVSNVTSGTVAISAKDGTFAVFFSPSRPVVLADNQHTSSIFTVSGTTSTAGNNTLVSPSASYNFKVFAYSLQTTGIVSSAPRFTTGASAGATELWRPLINSVQSASAPVGANLAIPPPAFLFATGTNTTLALYLDTGTLIHYSVSYIKESA